MLTALIALYNCFRCLGRKRAVSPLSEWRGEKGAGEFVPSKGGEVKGNGWIAEHPKTTFAILVGLVLSIFGIDTLLEG